MNVSNRRATSRLRTRGAWSGHQGPRLPQTNQRHATAEVQEVNRRLRAENDTLRTQNADLARELNDAKAKLKKTGQENIDLQRKSNQLELARRVLETRGAPQAASPATPPTFTFSASRRSRGEGEGRGSAPAGRASDVFQKAAHSSLARAQGGDGGVVGATAELASPSAVPPGLKRDSKATAVVCPAFGVPTPPTPGGGGADEDPWSGEAVHRIESPSRGFGARGRRSSILPNTLKDLGCGDRLRTPGRLLLLGRAGEENERPPSSSSRTQLQPPLSNKGGSAASRSLDPSGDGGSGSSSTSGSTSSRRPSRSLELSSSGEDGKGRGVSRSLDLVVRGNSGGGGGPSSSRRLELLGAGGGDGGGRGGGFLPENVVFRIDPSEGARDDDDELPRSGGGATAASSAANTRRWSASSYPPGLLVLAQPPQEFRSPDDNDDDDGVVDDDSAADSTRRRSSSRERLERRDTGWAAGPAGTSMEQGGLWDAAAVVPAARTGRGDAAAAAARRAPRREFSPPPPRRSPQARRRNAQPGPLASTPMPAMGEAPLPSRRPRRDVARPVSYEEPSLSIKMRKGHVMFPKTRLPPDGILPETGGAERERTRTEEGHGR